MKNGKLPKEENQKQKRYHQPIRRKGCKKITLNYDRRSIK
jgi:hypothetical protein